MTTAITLDKANATGNERNRQSLHRQSNVTGQRTYNFFNKCDQNDYNFLTRSVPATDTRKVVDTSRASDLFDTSIVPVVERVYGQTCAVLRRNNTHIVSIKCYMVNATVVMPNKFLAMKMGQYLSLLNSVSQQVNEMNEVTFNTATYRIKTDLVTLAELAKSVIDYVPSAVATRHKNLINDTKAIANAGHGKWDSRSRKLANGARIVTKKVTLKSGRKEYRQFLRSA